MNYCTPCRRHLNGALACPGCGTPVGWLEGEAPAPHAAPGGPTGPSGPAAAPAHDREAAANTAPGRESGPHGGTPLAAAGAAGEVS
ncbi:SCO2400 family protein [Streptomyces griseoaurantiacus]|uniref:SCO2400 family protein n=1 Tax=Streptomyces griseoaurantiacus TaxID=68213 RepID=UPI003F514C6D